MSFLPDDFLKYPSLVDEVSSLLLTISKEVMEKTEEKVTSKVFRSYQETGLFTFFEREGWVFWFKIEPKDSIGYDKTLFRIFLDNKGSIFFKKEGSWAKKCKDLDYLKRKIKNFFLQERYSVLEYVTKYN